MLYWLLLCVPLAAPCCESSSSDESGLAMKSPAFKGCRRRAPSGRDRSDPGTLGPRAPGGKLMGGDCSPCVETVSVGGLFFMTAAHSAKFLVLIRRGYGMVVTSGQKCNSSRGRSGSVEAGKVATVVVVVTD